VLVGPEPNPPPNAAASAAGVLPSALGALGVEDPDPAAAVDVLRGGRAYPPRQLLLPPAAAAAAAEGDKRLKDVVRGCGEAPEVKLLQQEGGGGAEGGGAGGGGGEGLYKTGHRCAISRWCREVWVWVCCTRGMISSATSDTANALAVVPG
jgi:hypothetical protein